MPGGTAGPRMRCACSAVVPGGIHPSRTAMRCTWVSMGKAARPMEKTSTQAAVFGPTPGSEVRYSSTAWSSRSVSRLRSTRPSRSRIAARICWIRRAFWSAIPPLRMASATCSAGASRTCSQSGNLALSWANARPELRSEVCWDRTVAISSSMTGNCGLGTNGPWLARSRRCTAAISDGSGTVLALSDEADEGVAQLALAAGAVRAVGSVHVDGDDPGAAGGGGHEADGPAGEGDLGAVRRSDRGLDADEG